MGQLIYLNKKYFSLYVCLLALLLTSIHIFMCYFVNMIFFPKSSVTVLLFSFAIYLGMYNLLLTFSSINSDTLQLICFALTNWFLFHFLIIQLSSYLWSLFGICFLIFFVIFAAYYVIFFQGFFCPLHIQLSVM